MKFEINPIALRKAKMVCSFGLSECNRVTVNRNTSMLCSVVENVSCSRKISLPQ